MTATLDLRLPFSAAPDLRFGTLTLCRGDEPPVRVIAATTTLTPSTAVCIDIEFTDEHPGAEAQYVEHGHRTGIALRFGHVGAAQPQEWDGIAVGNGLHIHPSFQLTNVGKAYRRLIAAILATPPQHRPTHISISGE